MKLWRIKTEYLSSVEHAFVSVYHLYVLYLDEYLLELRKNNVPKIFCFFSSDLKFIQS